MEPLENNHKHRRFLITAIVVVLGVLIGLFFLRRGRDDGGDQYRTEAASRGDITATVTATGTLSAVTTVQVGSQVSGIISRLYADFNSQVKKGQLLAELDPTPFLQTGRAAAGRRDPVAGRGRPTPRSPTTASSGWPTRASSRRPSSTPPRRPTTRRAPRSRSRRRRSSRRRPTSATRRSTRRSTAWSSTASTTSARRSPPRSRRRRCSPSRRT